MLAGPRPFSPSICLVLVGEDDPQQLLGAGLVLAGLAEMPMFEPPAKTGAGSPSLPGSDEDAERVVVPLADLSWCSSFLSYEVTDRPVRPAGRDDRGGGEGRLARDLPSLLMLIPRVVDVEPRLGPASPERSTRS